MPKVLVQQGWLEGSKQELVTKDGHYYSFKGVPYATPPTGKLRFKAPQPPLPWTGVRQATEHGPRCPQFNMFDGKNVKGDEDCLYLNVYTSDLTPAAPLPVMMWIHGGGFMSGSGNDDFYGPDFLVKHGVILVTFNYRLAALGFLCMDTLDVPGNAGMKDQVAALRWVQNNIKQFGGDPDNVTIFGESAGGAATGFHVLSLLSKGLFRRAILMSSVPTCDWCACFEPKKRAFQLGKQLGIDTDDPNKLLDFLQSLPVEKLVVTGEHLVICEDLFNSQAMKANHFNPVAEKNFGQEYFMNEDPFEALKAGRVNEVDLMIGHTSLESLFMPDMFKSDYWTRFEQWPEIFVPRKMLYDIPPRKAFELAGRIKDFYFGKKALKDHAIKNVLDFYTHIFFNFPIARFALRVPKVGKAKTYFYVFDMQSGRNFYGRRAEKELGVSGTSHMDDCFYLFHANGFSLPVETKSREYKLIQKTCQIFTDFAKYGDPTPDESLGARWPQFDAQAQRYYIIAEQPAVLDHPHADQLAFWRGIYEDASMEF